MDLSKVVWTFRDANGTPINLATAVANCTFMATAPIWQGLVANTYNLNANTSNAGVLTLSSNASYMASIPAQDFIYTTTLTDPSDNTTVQAMSGTLTVTSALGAIYPPDVVDTTDDGGVSSANVAYAS